MTSNNIFYRLTSWVFLAFCIEVILMAGGDWSDPFGFSARKMLFVLMSAMFALCFFSYKKVSVLNIKLFCYGLVFFVFFGFFIPLVYGVDLSLSIADMRPLVGLLLIPLIADFYKRTNYWSGDRNIVSVALLLLAIQHVLLWFVGSLSTEYGEKAISIMRAFYEPNISYENTKFNAVNYTPDGSFRVQWNSSCLLILGLYFGVMQFLRKQTFQNKLFVVVIIAALIVTQSRGMMLAILLGACFYVVFFYFLQLKTLNFLIYFYGVVILIFSTLLIIPFFTPEFLEFVGVTRDFSDSDRFAQVMPLFSNWLNHWFFGSGFGSGVEVVRSETAPYSYELNLLSIYMKIGVVGVFIAAILVSLLLHSLFSGAVRESKKQALVVIFSFVFIYIIASNTNPYLSNFFGMLTFYCFAFELAELKKSEG